MGLGVAYSVDSADEWQGGQRSFRRLHLLVQENVTPQHATYVGFMPIPTMIPSSGLSLSTSGISFGQSHSLRSSPKLGTTPL